jgi:hypothetical protein
MTTIGSPLAQPTLTGQPAGSRLPDILLAQRNHRTRPNGSTSKPAGRTRLNSLPGDGGIVQTVKAGRRVVVKISSREELRDGKWRAAGYVATLVASFKIESTVEGETPSKYGYPDGSQAQDFLIRARSGGVITDLAQAQQRVSELVTNGVLTTTKATQAAALQGATPLPKAVSEMSPADRAKYLLQETLRQLPASASDELKAMLGSWQTWAMMSAFLVAEAIPGVNIAANLVGCLLLGNDVLDTGGKMLDAFKSALSTNSQAGLVQAGKSLAEALAHAVVTVGSMGAAKAGPGAVKAAKAYTGAEATSLRNLGSTLTQYRNGKATDKQVRQAAIVAMQNKRAAAAKSGVAPSAVGKPGGKRSTPEQAAGQVRQQLNNPDLQAALARSKSPAAIERANKGIQQMQANGVPTAASIRPTNGPTNSAGAAAPGALTIAIKLRNYGNTSRAIANETLFDRYLSTIDGQPISAVMEASTLFNKLGGSSLAERAANYRAASSSQLSQSGGSRFTPQMSSQLGEIAHDTHTAFGGSSKLSEVHANTTTFNIDLDTSWAQRSSLPSQKGTTSKFWQADNPSDFDVVGRALTALEGISVNASGKAVSTKVQVIAGRGFAPRGSALAQRLGPLEKAAKKLIELQARMDRALTSERPKLQQQINTERATMAKGIELLRSSPELSRSQLLQESLGTPQTTYALVTRGTAAARYMRSVEGQATAVFDATAYRKILRQVQKEAGSAATAGPKWHQAMLKVYESNPVFQAAMNQSQAMQKVWAGYKAAFGKKGP